MSSENRTRALCLGTKCESNIAYDLEGFFSLSTRPESRRSSPLDWSVLKPIYFSSSQNMSLLLLPGREICFLLPLDKELQTPRELLRDLEKAEVRTLLRTLFCFKIQGLWKTPLFNIVRRFWRCLCSILQTSYKNISETSVIEHKWTVGSKVTDQSVLSDELANFCAKYPIYNVKKMENTLKTTRIQTGGERHIKTFKI